MRLLSLRSALVCVALVAEGACAWAGAGKATYLFTELGTLGGHDGGGSAINNAGTVIGESTTPNQSLRPTMWVGDEVIDLQTLCPAMNYALGINKTAQVVGRGYVGGHDHALLWDGASCLDLGTLGGAVSWARGINNTGKVVGFSALKGDSEYHATLWTGTHVVDLGTLGGSSSDAFAINKTGAVVGEACLPDGWSCHAALWMNDTATDLGTLPGGTRSTAYAINDAGQIVGNSEKAGAGRTATQWNGTTATDLGTLGGSGSTAYGINNAGTIVGAAYGFRARYSSLRATLWNGDGIVDLNALIDPAAKKAGWILVEARAITDRGQITGYARNKETKATCAFLLTPLR